MKASAPTCVSRSAYGSSEPKTAAMYSDDRMPISCQASRPAELISRWEMMSSSISFKSHAWLGSTGRMAQW